MCYTRACSSIKEFPNDFHLLLDGQHLFYLDPYLITISVRYRTIKLYLSAIRARQIYHLQFWAIILLVAKSETCYWNIALAT